MQLNIFFHPKLELAFLESVYIKRILRGVKAVGPEYTGFGSRVMPALSRKEELVFIQI